MSDPASSDSHRIVNVYLDEQSVVRRSAEVEHERAVAIFDLIEENRKRFQMCGDSLCSHHRRSSDGVFNNSISGKTAYDLLDFERSESIVNLLKYRLDLLLSQLRGWSRFNARCSRSDQNQERHPERSHLS